MAITSNFQKFGVTFEEAYTKVASIEYANSHIEHWELSEDTQTPPVKVAVKALKVKFNAQTFVSSESQDKLAEKEYFFVTEDGSNLIGECYEHLKGLEEFADAVDA
jgi:hypothetical protein